MCAHVCLVFVLHSVCMIATIEKNRESEKEREIEWERKRDGEKGDIPI